MINKSFLPAIASIKSKFSGNKKLVAVMAIGLAGIFLIALSSFGTEKEEPTINTEKSAPEQSKLQSQLQSELCSFLENIDSVNDVEVMLTYESSTESVYACDTQEDSDVRADGEERKYKSEHIIVKNNNNESGLELKEIYPKIRGVAIICDDGNNPVIKEQIISAVSALFDIKSTQISVVSKTA